MLLVGLLACLRLAWLLRRFVQPVPGLIASVAVWPLRLAMPVALGGLLVVAPIGSAFAQTVPPVMTVSPLTSAGGGIANLIEGSIVSAASQTGTALSVSGSAIDAAMGTALTTLEGEAVTAAGTAALGNPVTWAGVGAFAAGMAVTGTVYCLTNGCDVSATCKSTLQCVSSTIWTGLASMLYNPSTGSWLSGGGAPSGGLWCSSAAGPWVCAGTPSDAAEGAMVATFGSGRVSGCTATSSGATCTISGGIGSLSESAAQYPNVKPATGSSGTFYEDGYYYPITGSPSSGTVSPSSGVNISAQDGINPNGGTIFSAGNGTTSGGNSSVGNLTAAQLGEQASTADLASIANAVNKLASSTLYGTPNPPTTITAQQIQTLEAEMNELPTLSDFLAPVASGDLVTTNGSGQAVPSASVPATTLSQTGGALSPSATALNNSAPCGNVLAGETPCDEVLDFTYNPLTGSWEWMSESRELAQYTEAGKSLAPYANTSVLQQLQTEILTDQAIKSDVTTTTATGSQVDQLTDPLTATRDITATMSPTEEQLANPYTQPSPLPTVTLPFDEFPQVTQTFNTSVPSISGVCPTVTFTSSILNNTTFTIGAQCIVMNSLQPYMAYVLPPTYLLMALFLIMSA